MKITNLVMAPAFFLLAGCITYPYQTAFDSCDAGAGACYRYCEDVADNDYEYGRCHADCENEANACFAGAYDNYTYNAGAGAYGGSYYQPSWPWYGRYGAWGPSNGFYFDYSYSSRSNRYDRPRRGRGDGQGRGRGGYDGGYGIGSRPSNQRPPRRGENNNGAQGTPNRNDRVAPPPRQAPVPTAPGPSTSPPPAVQSEPPPAQQPAPATQPPPQKPPEQRPVRSPRDRDETWRNVLED